MPDNKKVCPFCGGEMALQHRGWLGLRENKLVSLTEEFVEAEKKSVLRFLRLSSCSCRSLRT
mgnify:CR=1 FL=1